MKRRRLRATVTNPTVTSTTLREISTPWIR
jgi:hypothetical protein